MSHQIDSNAELLPHPEISWYKAWLLGLLRPSRSSFEMLALDAAASTKRAYEWVLIAAVVGASVMRRSGQESPPLMHELSLRFALPFGEPIVGTVLFIVTVFTVHATSRLLRASGTHTQLAFTCAAFYAPLILVESLAYALESLSAIVATTVSIGLSVYTGWLTVVAVKTVHQFGWVRALVAASFVLGVQSLILALLVTNLFLPWLAAEIDVMNVLDLGSEEERGDESRALADALSARWDTDNEIPSASAGFERENGARWMAIELSYTRHCLEAIPDPCEALADELARIVLEQYAPVDELGGLQIIITNHDVYGLVDARFPNAHLGPIPMHGSTVLRSKDFLVKSFSIPEWREELQIE